MSEHLEDWFTTAQEKHANAVRLAFAVVTGLLAVYLTRITQHVAARHEFRAARGESTRLEVIGDANPGHRREGAGTATDGG